MDFERSETVERFRDWIRAFIADNLTPDMVRRARESGTQHDWEFHRAIAATGIIGQGLSAEPGADTRDPLEFFTLFDELGRADAPFVGLANTMLVAGVIAQVGSDFHRTHVLPRLHAGDAIVAFGYSEPDAGSDVAAASTRAVRTEDGWVINGQKMFTTLAHEAGYVILLTRTDPDVAKHRGLTMFLVPMETPGIEVRALYAINGDRTNITTFTDVVVGDEWRLGEVDGGWSVMLTALAYERGVFGNTNQAGVLLEQFTDWARQARGRDDGPLLDDPGVRRRIAHIAVDNVVGDLLSLRAAVIASEGGQPAIEGALAKLFTSERYVAAAEACQDMVGSSGALRPEAAGAPGEGLMEHATRDAVLMRIIGGTSEIARNLVAERRLGLPRAR